VQRLNWQLRFSHFGGRLAVRVELSFSGRRCTEILGGKPRVFFALRLLTPPSTRLSFTYRRAVTFQRISKFISEIVKNFQRNADWKTDPYHVRFEVFTAVTVKNVVFWDVALCGSCKNRRFGGKYCLHCQCENNQPNGNNVTSNYQLVTFASCQLLLTFLVR
jgi:hypothetical protein